MVGVNDVLHLRLQLLVGEAHGPARSGDRGLDAAALWKLVGGDRRAAVARVVRGRSLGVAVLTAETVHVAGMVAVRRHPPQELLDQALVAGVERHPGSRRLPEDQVGAIGVQHRHCMVATLEQVRHAVSAMFRATKNQHRLVIHAFEQFQ